MSKDKEYHSEFVDLDEFIQLPEKKRIETLDPAAKAVYQNNLDALGKHHPELVNMIESSDHAGEEERIELLYSDSGHPRVVYQKDNGEEVNIHSSDNPVECANQAIDLLGKMEKEGIIVLFGFGLGYFAEEIYKRLEKGHIILIYEATLSLMKAALHIKDFSELFESEKVKIILGEDADNFSVLHSHYHLIVNGKFWVIKHHPSVNLNKEAYERFFKRLDEERRVSDASVATIIGRGKEFINAFLRSVPHIIRKPGVRKLKNLFRGRPAIIVSAGTSLDKNVHLLKKAKGKAIIIAVDGALPTLLSCDIIPDMIVAVDPVSQNIDEKFRDIPVLEKVPFICLAQYTPELISLYPGPLFINGVPQNIAYQWLLDSLGDRGYIEAFGGSVAHLAFATAEYIGSDVIGLIGQDLSYYGDRVHTRGYSDVLDTELERCRKSGLDYPQGTIPVTDLFGEDAYTIPQFLSFKTSFENKFKQFRGTVVNATEGGMLIEGAVNMRLADFIEEYCGDLSELDTYSVLTGLADEDIEYDIDALIRTIKETRNVFVETRRRSKTILRYIKKLKYLKRRGQRDSEEFHNILSKVESLSESNKNRELNLLAGYHYGLELYLRRQDVQDVDEIEDEWERNDKQLERGKNYYSELIRAIELFNKQLGKLIIELSREKNIDSILKDNTIKKREKFFRAGMIYRKADVISQAVKYLEKALEEETSANDTDRGDCNIMDGKICSLYISLADLYIKQFNFYHAGKILNYIQNAGTSDDNQARIKMMLKICNEKLAAWHNRKKDMERHIMDAENKYGSCLESAYFYFRLRDFHRAEVSYLKAVKKYESFHNYDEKRDRLTEAYYGLAHANLAMNYYEQAVNYLEKAIENDPSNPVPYRDLGLIAIENNNFKPAEIFLAKAIELAPDEAELYRPLANLYMSLGENEKAVALYENALALNLNNPTMQHDLAIIYRETIAKAEGC